MQIFPINIRGTMVTQHKWGIKAKFDVFDVFDVFNEEEEVVGVVVAEMGQ